MRGTILQLTDSLQFGGAEHLLMDLVIGLKEHNFHPIVCSIDKGPLAFELERKGIEVIVISKKRSKDISLVWKLRQLVQKRNVELIHSHFPVSDIYGWIVSKICHIPQIITTHGDIFSKDEGPLLPFVLRYTDRIITVSHDLKRKLLGFCPLNVNNVQVIHNGIREEDVENQLIDKVYAKDRLNLKADNFVIGSIGGLRKVKGYEFLLEAIAIVRKVFPNVKLVLVGDGPQRSLLQQKAEKLGVSDIVIFLGWRKDIPQLLSAFDLYVCSSLKEGISISILEAMAASKPVIATNVGGNPEVVEDGKTGLLVPPKDPQKIAEAVSKLLDNENKQLEMGRAGLERVKEKFSISKTVREYKEVYLEVLHS